MVVIPISPATSGAKPPKLAIYKQRRDSNPHYDRYMSAKSPDYRPVLTLPPQPGCLTAAEVSREIMCQGQDISTDVVYYHYWCR
ncbi:hypothetical protein RRG08_047089 [Elysia crispata]|uniref:Uncharacterized protein n=1 Tax=Elysia crispata TaxID=231223 RepID=A0AAE1A8P6_9GAST|nr:hypothetical protein RRG08_047089 [Elysia crispata]